MSLPHAANAGSFRRTLVATTAIMVAALVAMAALLAVGLAQADDLLEGLRRSQDQLARVTRLQAEVERLRAEVATGAPNIVARMRSVDESLQAYRQSVLDEGVALGSRGGAHQAAEIQNAEALATTFAALRGSLLQGQPEPDGDAARERFEVLTGWAVAREQTEAQAASLAMTDLRRTLTGLAVTITSLMAVIGAAGVWMVLRTSGIDAGRRALADIDRNRRLFFSKVSHELRTPATVIRGEAEVALRNPVASPGQLRDVLGIVVANSAFLQRRLEDLLALARAEDGRLALREETFDLVEVARGAAAMAEPYVRANGLALATDLGDVPVEICGDPSWLQQAILALVDNAAKFADGRDSIRLTLSRRDGRAQIAVIDSGPGVAAEDLSQLFDSWYQTAEGRARGGSGLGLSVARWVVEQHAGAIRAQSALGEGLTIEIDLPVHT